MPSGDVRLSGTFVYSVETNKCIFRIASPSGSHTILVFAYQALWQYSDGDSPNGASNADGVGKHRDSQSISGYMLTVRLPSVIHSAAMDHGNVMTVAGKRRRLFFTIDDDEVFMTRSLKISPNTTEQHLIVRTRKREAEIIIKDCAQGIILLKLSTDRHKASRDLCDSRATCNTRNSAVAERPRDASSLSVVKSTILRVQSFITSYFGFTFTITNANNLILFCSLRRATETCDMRDYKTMNLDARRFIVTVCTIDRRRRLVATVEIVNDTQHSIGHRSQRQILIENRESCPS